MTRYEFALNVTGDPTEYAEQLFEVAEGELVPESGTTTGLVHATHEDDTFVAAVIWATTATESVGLAVTGVASTDTVSLKDIAARAGRTYEWVRRLSAGERGPGGFPASFGSDSWSLYSWAEVSAWLAEHYGGHAVGEHEWRIAATDHLLRVRHMLPTAERHEFADLVTSAAT